MAEEQGERKSPYEGFWGPLNTCLEACCVDSAARNFYRNCEFLLDSLYRMDCNHRDRKGRTPLHYIAMDNRIQVLKLLLIDNNIPTDLNSRDREGRTPLHYACRNGNDQVAVALCRLGADHLTKDNHGWTPLDAARFNKRFDLLTKLKGNLRAEALNPEEVGVQEGIGTTITPSRRISVSDLKGNLPVLEKSAFGTHVDDVFIPNPNRQSRRALSVGNSRSSLKFTPLSSSAAEEVELAVRDDQELPPLEAPSSPPSISTHSELPLAPGVEEMASIGPASTAATSASASASVPEVVVRGGMTPSSTSPGRGWTPLSSRAGSGAKRLPKTINISSEQTEDSYSYVDSVPAE